MYIYALHYFLPICYYCAINYTGCCKFWFVTSSLFLKIAAVITCCRCLYRNWVLFIFNFLCGFTYTHTHTFCLHLTSTNAYQLAQYNLLATNFCKLCKFKSTRKPLRGNANVTTTDHTNVTTISTRNAPTFSQLSFTSFPT